MDAHTEYAPDYVRQCVAALSETAADNVGGPARTRAESYRQKAIAAAYHSAFAVGGARFHNIHYKGYVDTVTYGCWLKQAFERFGYFDEELVRNQDDEHNLRIVRGGGKIYQDPKICSWYRPRSSLKALFHQYRQYGYWKVRVIQKHRFAGSWRHFVPGVFVLTLLVLALVWVSSAIWVWASGFLNSHAGIRSTVPDRVAMESLRVLSSLLIAYATALLIASFVASRKASWKLFPLLPVVFMCYHFAYGWGFLRGAWDFVVLGRKAAPSYTRLTRDPSNPEKTPNL